MFGGRAALAESRHYRRQLSAGAGCASGHYAQHAQLQRVLWATAGNYSGSSTKTAVQQPPLDVKAGVSTGHRLKCPACPIRRNDVVNRPFSAHLYSTAPLDGTATNN